MPLNKTINNENIGIVEKEKVLSCDDNISKTFISFFSVVIRLLCISQTDYRIYLDEIQDDYFGKRHKKYLFAIASYQIAI